MTEFNRNRKLELRGREGVSGRDLSCDWLPPPPHGKVLGPLAAAKLRVRGRGGGGTEPELSFIHVDAASLREPAVGSDAHPEHQHPYLSAQTYA